MKIFILIFLLFAIFIFLILKKTKSVSNFHMKKKGLKGIVFFDIDDTLTNISHEEIENVVNYSKEKGYSIGIITASLRTPGYVCDKNKANLINSKWATDKLCSELNKNNFKLFNSLSTTSGNFIFKFPEYEKDEYFYGKQKGWQMLQTAIKQNVDPSNTFLFDDNIFVLKGAEKINPKGNFIHVDNNTDHKKLNIDLISKILV